MLPVNMLVCVNQFEACYSGVTHHRMLLINNLMGHTSFL